MFREADARGEGERYEPPLPEFAGLRPRILINLWPSSKWHLFSTVVIPQAESTDQRHISDALLNMFAKRLTY